MFLFKTYLGIKKIKENKRLIRNFFFYLSNKLDYKIQDIILQQNYRLKNFSNHIYNHSYISFTNDQYAWSFRRPISNIK